MTNDFDRLERRSRRQFERGFLFRGLIRFRLMRRQVPAAPELELPPFLRRLRLEAQAELGAEAFDEDALGEVIENIVGQAVEPLDNVAREVLRPKADLVSHLWDDVLPQRFLLGLHKD